MIPNATNWLAATNNSIQISNAVSSLDPVFGGRVVIPPGTFYMAQYYPPPDETANALFNAAVRIYGDNVEICGSSQSLTTLVAYNRATTIFTVGAGGYYLCTNFTLRDMTLEGAQHLAVNSTNSTMTVYEKGELQPVVNVDDTGSLVAVYARRSIPGLPLIPAVNILISNCTFRHAYRSLALEGVSNCIVRQCQFYPWDSNSLFDGETNNLATTPNTVDRANNNVSIMASAFNVIIVENIYNGNSTRTNINTNTFGYFGPDGFVWLQSGGNAFVARNAITNYMLEAIQVNAGPNAVVANTEYSLLSVQGCCGLCAVGANQPGLTGKGLSNYSTTFIGNSIYGGCEGEQGFGNPGYPYTLNFSGNSLYLFPPFDEVGSGPSAAAEIGNFQTINICGNTLLNGSFGVWYDANCGSVLILNNDFSGATYRGIGYMNGDSSLPNAQIYQNIFGEGLSFDAQIAPYNGSGWFLYGNQRPTGQNSVPLFLDPAASSTHISP